MYITDFFKKKKKNEITNFNHYLINCYSCVKVSQSLNMLFKYFSMKL